MAGEWEISSVTVSDVAPTANWEISSITVDTGAAASNGAWEVSAITVNTGTANNYLFKVVDTMGLTEGNSALDEITSGQIFVQPETVKVTDIIRMTFPNKYTFQADPTEDVKMSDNVTLTVKFPQSYVLPETIGVTDNLNLATTGKTFLGLPKENVVLSDSVVIVVGSSQRGFSLVETMSLRDNPNMNFGNTYQLKDRDKYSTPDLQRLYYALAQQLPADTPLSIADLQYLYYSQRSGRITGTLADHISAWLALKQYNTMSEYLDSFGYTGGLDSKLRKFFGSSDQLNPTNTGTPGGGGSTDPLLLTYGGANYGDANYGGF